jgi:hypothetical protein
VHSQREHEADFNGGLPPPCTIEVERNTAVLPDFIYEEIAYSAVQI